MFSLMPAMYTAVFLVLTDLTSNLSPPSPISSSVSIRYLRERLLPDSFSENSTVPASSLIVMKKLSACKLLVVISNTGFLLTKPRYLISTPGGSLFLSIADTGLLNDVLIIAINPTMIVLFLLITFFIVLKFKG